MSFLHIEYYASDRQLPATVARNQQSLIGSEAVEIGAIGSSAIPSTCGFIRMTAEAPCVVMIASSTPDMDAGPRYYLPTGHPLTMDRGTGSSVYVRDVAPPDA